MKKSAKFFIIGIVVGLVACSSIWLPMQQAQSKPVLQGQSNQGLQAQSNPVNLVKVIRKSSSSLPGASGATVTAKCKLGETISGGGYNVFPTDITISKSQPNIIGNEWQVTGHYYGPSANTNRYIEAYAVCISLSIGPPHISIKPTKP